MVEYTTKFISRFWSQVNKTDDCWLWTGSMGGRNKDYGVVSSKGKTFGSHRIAYELIKGEIPEGFCIDHLCRNPSCVNPAHLEAVTFSVNTTRGNIARGQTKKEKFPKKIGRPKEVKTHCKYGHELNSENVGYHSHISPKGKKLGPYAFCRTCGRERDRNNWHTKYKLRIDTSYVTW